jgi:formate transporter
MSTPSFSDPHSPADVADRLQTIGVTKARMATSKIILLAILAGAFISLGAMYYTVVMTEPSTSWGASRMLGGIAFSLGFVLVVIAGAELFTGNNLIVMAWANGLISSTEILRNWLLVYIANTFGALSTLALLYLSGFLHNHDNQVGVTAIKIAIHKVDHSFVECFFLGLFCNALVCLASWMTYAARSVTDKIMAILLPISAFVAMGFEHCIANMFMIPLGIVAALDPEILSAGSFSEEQLALLNTSGFINNIIPVTLGNIVGGAVLVAFVYYFIYLRNKSGDSEIDIKPFDE